jgi:hypothetical protein
MWGSQQHIWRHDATLKTYIKITSSYYWPSIYQDIKQHVQTCLTCQQWKRAPVKPMPLAPLLIPEWLKCLFIQTYVDSQWQPKICAMHHRCIYQICYSHCNSK